MDIRILMMYKGAPLKTPSGKVHRLTGVCQVANTLTDECRVQVRNTNKTQWFDAQDVKLILRPISSMSQDEMKELYKLVFKRDFLGDSIQLHDNGKPSERWVLWSGLERLFIYTDSDVEGDCDLNHKQMPKTQILLWQLKKCFDVFKLHDSKECLYMEDLPPSLRDYETKGH